MKESVQPRNLLISHRFEDFDAFDEAAAGWDLDFRQMECGSFKGTLTHIVTQSVILADCAFNRKIEQRGATPAGCRTFGIPADDALNLRWRGKSVGPDHLLLFPQGAELDSVSRAGFHVFAFSVSEPTMAAAAERRGLISIEELFPQSDLIRCPRVTLRRLQRLASNLSHSARARPGIVNAPSFLNSLEEELVTAVLDAITGGKAAEASLATPRSRSQSLKKALDVIADRAADPITVAELEKLSGASGRTLRYAFEDAFGLSPKRYLQNFRLNHVRRALLRATSAETTISHAANEWGFWHMGQFAADYRRMFGELPSETLGK